MYSRPDCGPSVRRNHSIICPVGPCRVILILQLRPLRDCTQRSCNAQDCGRRLITAYSEYSRINQKACQHQVHNTGVHRRLKRGSAIESDHAAAALVARYPTGVLMAIPPCCQPRQSWKSSGKPTVLPHLCYRETIWTMLTQSAI
jgi:hypothetical protein